MNKFTFGIFCLGLVIVISGCSRKKDNFINRNWHAVTSEYNTLYNGSIAFDQGRQQIDDSYQENFWQILPVERMQFSEEIRVPGEEGNEFFQVAEEKATKAIQRHSMQIEGREKNPQIDEAYLLLGKARYYDQRFIPALEAFNYILHKYPASNTITHARIWREKTNIRLENNNLAIKNLKKILDAENLKDQDRADANAMLAQAYINTAHLDSALVPIKTAAGYTKKNAEKGRYHYIEGQLHNYLGEREDANLAFAKVIDLNRKSPREYFLNAHLEKARNFDYSQENPRELLAFLTDLEEDRENRPFLDKIHFQLAEYYKQLDSTNLAVSYYNLSLEAPSNDEFLRSVNYETLGNIYFDKTDYRTAGAYYDSTLTKISETSRDYFVIKRKRENLQEVIHYEEIAEKNDSILSLVAMNDDERLTYFTQYTDSLKTAAIIKAKEGDIAEVNPPAGRRTSPGLPPGVGGANQGSSFYFYNPNRLANGMQEFLKVWGKRSLQDNWRTNTSSFSENRSDDDELDEVTGLIIENNPQFDPDIYLEQVPQDLAVIDSLASARNDAYYRLGLIYKEKFHENGLASEKLESLLDLTSEENLLLPASYFLYQIYLEEGELYASEKHKNIVLENYPDSRYAARIKNPDIALDLESQAEKNYSELYQLFSAEEFEQVLELGTAYSAELNDGEILPKIELLKAMAIGRLYGFEAYKEALNDVALNYSRTNEGKKAQQLYNSLLPQLENSKFAKAKAQENIKLLYSFGKMEKAEAEKLKEKIDGALADLKYNYFSTSIDVYDVDTIFVVVHKLPDISRAEGFAELLNINEDYLVKKDPVVISSENYRIVQLHKNLTGYIEQQAQP